MALADPAYTEADLAGGIIIERAEPGDACTHQSRSLKAAACAVRAPHHASDVVEQKSRGVVGFAEFTRPFEDAPSNVERLLKEVGVGHARKKRLLNRNAPTQGQGRAVMARSDGATQQMLGLRQPLE
jgi:hypothetical protein